MSSTLKRPVILLYDKNKSTYDDSNVQRGELIVDSALGFAYIKMDNGEIVPIKGAGYVDLLNYIENTTAIGVTPKDLHSFYLDTSTNLPDPDAPAGLWKIRVKSATDEKFKEVALITNGDHCIIYTGKNTEEGEPITVRVSDFYADYVAYKKSSTSTIEDHEERLGIIESNIADRIIDKVIYYKSFNNNEVRDILFKVTPNRETGTKYKNEFESTIVLGTDDGTSINKHFLGLTVDNVDNTHSPNHFYIRDIGNVVDLSVKFYYKDGNIYIRPTQTEGEFILRDKSTNKGAFQEFSGSVSIVSWSASGLTPANEIRPLGEANNEESTHFVYNQNAHGFTGLVPAYFDASINKWKRANLENRATALLARIDDNYVYAYTSGHIRVPDGLQLQSNKMYYLSQTEEGDMQTEEPTMIYQEIGYCYSKNGVLWFAVSIGTPVELAPYVIKNLATKTEMSQRVRYVASTDDIQNLDEPLGCVIMVADLNDWHMRRVEESSRGTNPYQLQNGMWANETSSDPKLIAMINEKYSKGTNIANLSKYPTASDLIDAVESKLTVPESFEGDFNTLLSMINGKLNISDLSQSMSTNNANTAPSSAIFKQLVDIVQGIAEGGTGAIVPQDNTPVHFDQGTLVKNSKSITASAHVLYNPLLIIEGQVMPRSSYTFVANTGVITLDEIYSVEADVAYTIIDVFPTDIRFIADTVGHIEAAPYAPSIKVGDVIRVLGRNSKYDGGGHLRIVESTKKLDGIAFGDNFLNKVPNSDLIDIMDIINSKADGSEFEGALESINTALEAKVETTTFNNTVESINKSIATKLASETFTTYSNKNKIIVNDTGYANHSTIIKTVSWAVGQSNKSISISAPYTAIDATCVATLVSSDGESGNCNFKITTSVSGTNITVNITPILNGQVYTAIKNTMSAKIIIHVAHQ